MVGPGPAVKERRKGRVRGGASAGCAEAAVIIINSAQHGSQLIRKEMSGEFRILQAAAGDFSLPAST